MDDHREQHDDLAMRHVLGGLEGDEANTFRQHLLGCGTCRRRVVELRGIAADLQQVDRRERASLAALRTEAPPQVDGEDATDGEPSDDDVPLSVRRSERLLGVALVVGVLVVVALAFWNLHLRSREAVLFDTIEDQQTVLEMMVTGRPVATRLGPGVRGSVVVVDGRYAVDVSGIDADPDARLALWFLDDEGGLLPASTDLGPAARLPDGGLFASSGAVGSAGRLVLTVEDAFDLRAGPGSDVLVEAELGPATSDRD